jgi:hypothetical protein
MPAKALDHLSAELEGLRRDYESWRDANRNAVPETRLAMLEFVLKQKVDAISATVRSIRQELSDDPE